MKVLNKYMLVFMLGMMPTLAACTGSSGGNNSVPSAAAVKQPANNSTQAEPLGKYDQPITAKLIQVMGTDITFPQGDSHENNVWTRAFKQDLGIDVKYDWVVGTQPQYDEKLNISIAAGSLPDIFAVNIVQLKQLADAGLLADLTGVYDKFKSPEMHKRMMSDDGISIESAKFDGKLMALPNVGSNFDPSMMVWVRKDWLEKLKLPEPKTLEDLLVVAKAFKEKDPDGDGQANTYGLALQKNLFDPIGGLTGFANAFHAYPQIWIKDASGKLMNGSIQPEIKNTLAKLQELFKEGLITKEFGVKEMPQLGEDIIAGRVGIFYGNMSVPLYPLQNAWEKNPNANWQYYPLMSSDDKLARPQIQSGAKKYYVVNKSFKYPEAAVKLMNEFVEKRWGKTADAAFDYDRGNSSWGYALLQTVGTRKNLDNHIVIKEALQTSNTSKLNAEQLGSYNQIKKFMSGDKSFWKIDKIFGVNGSLSLQEQEVVKNVFISNEFYSAPTPTMTKRTSTLNDLINETYTKIIMGAPIDTFDKFVEDWKKLGGDAITKEVNEWYASRKK
jgi:putative aldouronate transport system substrate-binding protein